MKKHCSAILHKFLLFLISGCCIVLSGCGKKTSVRAARSAYIEVQELETDTTPSVDTAKANETSSLPYFRVKSGEATDEINRLNEIVDDVKESYENALQDENERYAIVCEKTEGSRYLVATMYITDDWISLTGKARQEKNIVTLAYDKQKDAALTSTEALQSTGITGVQLSQRAEQQLKKLQEEDPQYEGNLRSTEMQGFSLDDNGKVNDIFMKLVIDTGGEEPDNFFFHFDPADSSMTPLAWP